MRLAMLGGSFNPLHLGHLQLADECVAAGYDTVVLVPAYIAAHKDPVPGDSPEERLAMVRMVAGAYGFETCDCEIRRGGISYTIDTIEYLTEHYKPSGRVGLVIGEDLLAGFHKWRRYRELLSKVDLLLARRGPERTDRQDIRYTRLGNPDFPVSSTDIRERVASGRPYRFLVPPEIESYIRDRGLYSKQPGVAS
ncbi:nicotinate (nicotinamide) nucleotide adenylyltransferase [Marispirochaeta aestuarii]|uniref:Probable nicotinate-nucleotide adenylyltransferase n=1 Tax=Marispirochaeta aestuarii TaxID=1963862 RepID=A0A1Y1S185_9SPIO|nr:nicotinate (nicotinamide) nucleotide adenylyltransferase [Marispirochaeta aestuarii]ORC37193.1 nicotinate (nicotinamide) nucleotide adenylyltransferase [Marispirochaeta aestuarii]